MIVDWERFVAQEKPRWDRLEEILARLARDPYRRLELQEIAELEGLYQRSVADLARLSAMAIEPATQRYLEHLVGRAYAEIHGGRPERRRLRPWFWFSHTLPQTFRRHLGAFWFACALLFSGCVFGALALALDPESKEVTIGFGHLKGSPSERVAREEAATGEELSGRKASFAGELMTHNTKVTYYAASLGMTWGVGTLVVLFYNGVGLGAVAADYVLDGQLVFLLGWLLPHGVIEIPAILIGGQSGFLLAGALIGRRQNRTLAARMRAAAPEVVTLLGGATLMLVWAGVVEAFLSQYHEPFIPYWAKISFGCCSFLALVWFFAKAGAAPAKEGPRHG